ncbi:MAG: hypothetical protein JNG86_07820, partial [Verrucomicrobiaceae bacterium]|nr:hypothetical protein [Verrucomicrobiaceae bacterium]
MSTPDNKIQRAWITAGSSRLWDTQGTYSSVSYDRLPKLPATEMSFSWLVSLPDRDYGSTLDSDSNQLESLPSIQRELSQLGFALPDEFVTFVTTSDLYSRIPTCTDCYLELSDTVTNLPGFPGSHVVRFMNDSQSCVLWYLLFQPTAPVRVLASGYFIERDIFDAMEYLTDEEAPLAYEDVLSDACICAESFGEFICRFGLENMIWFATHEGYALSALEEAY